MAETESNPTNPVAPFSRDDATAAHELLQKLKLGVEGQGGHADIARLGKASIALAQYEGIYPSPEPTSDEEKPVTEPFGISLLVQHDGNLSNALADPRIEDQIFRARGVGTHNEPEENPDPWGSEWEPFTPDYSEEGRKKIAGVITALNTAVSAETVFDVAPEVIPALRWAHDHNNRLFTTYLETFGHAGTDEERPAILERIIEGSDRYAQSLLERAQERANGIAIMINLGRTDLAEIAGKTGINLMVNEQNITPRLIAALEQSKRIDPLYEAGSRAGFRSLPQVELWDDEAQRPYSIAEIVLDKENSDMELSHASTEAWELAIGQEYGPDIRPDGPLADGPEPEEPLTVSETSPQEARLQRSQEAYDLRRAAFEELGMVETEELLPGRPQPGDVLRLEQLIKKDGTTPHTDEANAYLIFGGDPEPEVILGIKDWAEYGYRALPGTFRPTLENAPKLRPVRGAALTPGNVIVTLEGDRQKVLSSKREGLNVKVTFSSNINPSEQETMTLPAYRRIYIEQPTPGAPTQHNAPGEPEPEPEHHHQLTVTNHSTSPGLA